jgi:hypothetical protein
MNVGNKVRLKLAPTVGSVSHFLGVHVPDPLFIVGTGRCGSSLLARILRSHPQVVGFPNEANDLWHPSLYPHSAAKISHATIEVDPKKFTESSVASWPAHHSRRIRRVLNGFHVTVGRDKVFFVKSAMISFLMPQLVDLFPDARFLHIYRYGPSVVRSAFKKNSAGRLVDGATEETWHEVWAGYWNDCIMEIDRAHHALALDQRGAFFECSYESLCDDPTGSLYRIAEYIGVDERQFTFDLGRIKSTNFKVAASSDTPWVSRMLSDTVRYPAMRQKGYVS